MHPRQAVQAVQAAPTLTLHMNSSELATPWLPMPLSRKPWKGKWSGPRAGALFTCRATMP